MLRRWFGPDQNEIWRRLSEDLGGRHSEEGFCRRRASPSATASGRSRSNLRRATGKVTL